MIPAVDVFEDSWPWFGTPFWRSDTESHLHPLPLSHLEEVQTNIMGKDVFLSCLYPFDGSPHTPWFLARFAQKLILSEKKSRAKHHAGDGGGSGMSGMMGGRRGVDGGEASDDDEAEGDTRDRGEGRGRPGAKEKKQKGT